VRFGAARVEIGWKAPLRNRKATIYMLVSIAAVRRCPGDGFGMFDFHEERDTALG
jgi:hypothetical protein